MRNRARQAFAVAVIFGARNAPPIQAQSAKFEVASIKPFDPPSGFFITGQGGTLRISGDTVNILGSPLGLVMAAYNLREFQVSGAPHWSDKLGRQQDYQITAKAESAPTLDQARQMLRTLLAERLQLKIHGESREMPVYDLVVDKNGPKLKEHVGETVPPELPVQSGNSWRIKWSNRSISDLINLLSTNVDRPVVDKTGLPSGYDFTLEYTRSNPDLVPRDSPDADTSIFSAIQKQLGLKLNAAKEPVEILVIDHIERPSEN